MADRIALLQAVAAAPDDTLVRRVYADFLEESGKPEDARRAEFIRLQCEYAQLVPPRGGPQSPDTPTWELWESAFRESFTEMFADDLATERKRAPLLKRLEEVRDRVKELFTAHGNEWVQEAAGRIGLPAPASDKLGFWRVVGVLSRVSKRAGWPYAWGHTSVSPHDPKGLPAGFRSLVFWCGFADELWIDPTEEAVRPVVEKWLQVGPARRLVLSESEESRGGFWPTAEHLRSVGTLTLDLELTYNLFQALTAAQEAGVSSLELLVRHETGNTLAASDLIRSVRRLQLTVKNTNDFETLAATETPALRELVLDFDFVDENCSAGDEFYESYGEVMGKLAGGVFAANLESLTVQYAAGNADLVRHLTASPPWRWVKTLVLDFPLNPAAVIAFAEGTGLPDVTDLTLCLNRKTMTGEPYKSPPDPDEEPPRRRWRTSEDEPKKARPIPVAKPVDGPVLVARRVGATPVVPPPPEPAPPAEIPVAAAAPDPNGWAGALRALSRWSGLPKLKRLRLVVRSLRANLLDMDFFNVDGEPQFVGLPAHALGRLAAALSAGGQLERLEIAGPTVDTAGRFELTKHLPGKVVYL